MAEKHPDEITAQPWHFLDFVSPASRPLLALSAIAPSASSVLARSVLASASAADALGLKRVALAGATVLYGVQMFRGAGRAAGGGRAAFAQYREYRRAFADPAGKRESSAYRQLTSAISADYEALVESRARYEPERPAPRSPASAFAVHIGFQLVVAYRLMRYMRDLDLPLAARVVGRAIRHLYGSDIHPEAEPCAGPRDRPRLRARDQPRRPHGPGLHPLAQRHARRRPRRHNRPRWCAGPRGRRSHRQRLVPLRADHGRGRLEGHAGVHRPRVGSAVHHRRVAGDLDAAAPSRRARTAS